MGQDINISIAKLSSPVEVLSIHRRACRTLRRASVYTVAEVLLHGKPKLGSFRRLGPVTASHIWEAVAQYLGLPEDRLDEASAASAGSDRSIWTTSIRALPLPASTLLVLESTGCFQVDELLRTRALGYEKFLGLGHRETGEIDEALRWYLARAAQMGLLSVARSDAILGGGGRTVRADAVHSG